MATNGYGQEVLKPDEAVVPWDFGPPTGRGMRATRPLSKGDVVCRVPGEQLISPRKCRELLLNLAGLRVGGYPPLPERFTSLEDITPRSGNQTCAQVLDNADEVFAACRSAGIDAENDESRRRLLKRVVLIVSVDPSDDTAEVRLPSEPDGECVWFAITALRRPSLEDAIAAISDENSLVTAITASCVWRERATSGCAESSMPEALVEGKHCPGLKAVLLELPERVGLPAEWSDAELDGLTGSLHAARFRRSRSDVASAYAIVSGLLKSSTSNLGVYSGDDEPMWGTEKRFSWAWVRVASRNHDSVTFPHICGASAGKNVMIPGIDLFNHSIAVPPGKSIRESSDGQFVEVVAATECSAGDQVFISYGAMGNWELLLGYGFAVEGNPHDTVELLITLEKVERGERLQGGTDACSVRADLCFHCIASFGGGACELMPSKVNETQPQVKLNLSTSNCLSGALLGLSRLERLSDADLMRLHAALGRQEFRRRLQDSECFVPEKGLVDLEDVTVRCVALRSELRALCSLRALFKALLAAYPSTVTNAACDEESVVRFHCCETLCNAEKVILHAALEKTESLLSTAIGLSLDTARLLGKGESSESSVRSQLAAASDRVEARSADTVEFFQELTSRPPLPHGALDVTWSQTCSFFFWLLHSGVSHRSLDCSVPDIHDCWSCKAEYLGQSQQMRLEANTLPRRWTAWEDSTQPQLLSLFRSKTSMWGQYLFAQFLSAGAVSIEAINTMSMESIDIRKSNAWSVPTPEALSILAEEAPLVELGAGQGLWADLLQKRGVQIRAFDTGAWDASFAPSSTDIPAGDGLDGTAGSLGKVERGGPEALAGLGGTCNALVLMWPDYNGAGSFGLECVRRWTVEEHGRRLICVGEWRGTGTLGTLSSELPAHGQSFSEEFQDFVEEHYNLLRIQALPNWPLFLDALRVFERR